MVLSQSSSFASKKGRPRPALAALPVVAILTLTLISLTASAQSGTWSGGIAFNYTGRYSSYYSVTGGGQWSITTNANDQISGGSNYKMIITINEPECTWSSPITVNGEETWTGTLQGEIASIDSSATFDYSPSSVTMTCQGPGLSGSTTVPLAPYSFTYSFNMALSQLETGGQQVADFPSPPVGTGVAMQETFSLSSAGSFQQSTTVPTSSATETTTPSSTTTAGSTTSECQIVNPSEHISICVPDWLSGTSDGTVSVINPDGNSQPFTGTVPPGSTLETGAGSLASETYSGTTATEGSDSSMTENACVVTSSGPYCFPETTALELSHTASEALDQALEGHTTMALWKLGSGIYHVETELLSNIQNYVVPGLMTGNMIVVDQPPGSEAVISVRTNGTALQVLDGTWTAINLVSGQAVNVSAGQSLFISSNHTLASQQNLKSSVQSFNSSSLSHWWAPDNPPGNAIYGLIIIMVILFLVLSIGAYAVRRKNRAKNKGGSATPVTIQPLVRHPAQTSVAFCADCGSKVEQRDTFCGNCGRRVT